MELIVPAYIMAASPFQRKNWNAKLSLTICIRIILPREPICLLNLNCADQVGRRKTGRYMREMDDITPIYPKMNLSKRMKQAKVCPYLLRNAVIDRPNQAWSIDKPLIINSDQGSQFTSDKYIDFIRNNGIRQSMDGKSRWADNIMIERWFRSFKYEEAYLTEYANLKEAREAIGRYIYTYNFKRCHQSIGNKRPAEVYYTVMLLDAARAAA